MLFLILLAALSPLIVWFLWAAYAPRKAPARPANGHEFAAAHGNDSSNWSSADFEAAQVFASIDIQPVWLLAHPKPDTTEVQPIA